MLWNGLAIKPWFKKNYTLKDTIHWYEKANDHIWALNNLGSIYFYELDNTPGNIELGLSYFHRAAELGNTLSHKNLADIYYYSKHGIIKDHKKALYHAKAASEGGNDYASLLSGIILRDEEKDHHQAISYFERAYSQDYDYGRVMYQLGYTYESIDPDEAFAHYHDAADAGYAPGIRSVGFCYEHALGTDASIQQAEALYLEAIDAGDTYARYLLGSLYYRKKKENNDKALEYLLTAIQDGHPAAHADAGSIYWDKGDQDTAFKHWLKSAQQGNHFAIKNISILYRDGLGTEADDEKYQFWLNEGCKAGIDTILYDTALLERDDNGYTLKSASLLQRAVEETDYKPALLEWGKSFLYSKAQKNYSRALECFEQYAAEYPNKGEAYFRIAQIHDMLEHALQGPESTWQNYQRAYQNNYPAAGYNLAQMLEEGIGVIKNLKASEAYYLELIDLKFKPAFSALCHFYFQQNRPEDTWAIIQQGIELQIDTIDFYHAKYLLLKTPSDPHGAISILKEYVKQNGAGYALLYSAYQESDQQSEANKTLKIGTEEGCATCSALYSNTLLLAPQADPLQAFIYAKYASDNDIGLGDLVLGIFYQKHSRKGNHMSLARQYFIAAIDKGEELAYSHLAIMDLLLGNQSASSAYELIQQGIKKNCPQAHYLMGLTHMKGTWGYISKDEGIKYFSMAAELGSPTAQRYLNTDQNDTSTDLEISNVIPFPSLRIKDVEEID
ncbi:SEL1-like repeat protein [Aliamphritea ceti]|uniref:SEL1-like repeat protein n=1 Tax=Aliamphritea ceti TaxID=1524258 RepID=UPI0021C3F22F|nr:sel1 repeat family protein [Aliamphritea ceti]